MPLDRLKLQKLADRYLRDADMLRRSRAWSSAYYLAGYAVECALKARIAKQFRKHEFPNLKTVQGAHTHKLEELLGLAGLKDQLADRRRASDSFGDNWDKVVVKWRETSRYDQPTKAMAEELLRAISDTKEGVLPWIKLHW
jgi:hypothetical protein